MSEQQYASKVMFALAKQVATFNGQIFEKLDQKNRAALMTLANSLYATLKRLENER